MGFVHLQLVKKVIFQFVKHIELLLQFVNSLVDAQDSKDVFIESAHPVGTTCDARQNPLSINNV